MKIVNTRIAARVIGKMLCKSGSAFQITEGVPKDAEVIGVAYDEATENFIIGYEHESFMDIQAEEPIPEVETFVAFMQPTAVNGDENVV